MNTICYTSALILRCDTLTQTQSIVLLIPPSLGLIFSSSLLVAGRGSNRASLLLAVEGWSYFSLAVLDLIAHIIPGITSSASAFKIIDIVIGLGSLIPLFCYLFFLFLFVKSEAIPVLPERFHRVIRYVLLAFILVVLPMNELGSFLGISYGLVVEGSNTAEPGLGLLNGDQGFWIFFTTVTLALIMTYQALVFFLMIFRLAKAFLDQRRFDSTGADQGYLFKGTGWVSLGIKLGAIESIIGFAQLTPSQSGFDIAFVRRALRFISRACLIIGVVKGVDTVENFQQFFEESRENIQKLKISRPIGDSFTHLSPAATTFYAQHSQNKQSSSNIEDLESNIQIPSTSTQQEVQIPPQIQTRLKERVTIHVLPGQAPVLEMRFSTLDIPSPTKFRSRSRSDGSTKTRTPERSHISILSVLELSESPTRNAEKFKEGAESTLVRNLSVRSDESTMSLSDVRNLAMQFPGPPPHVLAANRGAAEALQSFLNLSRGNSSKTMHSAPPLPPLPLPPLITPKTSTFTPSSANTLFTRQPSYSTTFTDISEEMSRRVEKFETYQEVDNPDSNTNVHHRASSSDMADIHYQVKKAWRPKPSLARFKSMGQVVRQSTPTPTHVEFSRDSVAIEPVVEFESMLPDMGSDKKSLGSKARNTIRRKPVKYEPGEMRVRTSSAILGGRQSRSERVYPAEV